MSLEMIILYGTVGLLVLERLHDIYKRVTADGKVTADEVIDAIQDSLLLKEEVDEILDGENNE